MQFPLNRSSYDAIASAWDGVRTSFYGCEKVYLDRLLDGLPAPSPILDLGCGTGRPIDEYILSQGHQLTGVDQATQLLNIARSRLPAGRWIESSIETFESTEQFAAIVCWDALFHIDRSLHESIFARMATLLNPGGKVMLTVGGSEHPAFTDTMFGETFFYDSHPPEMVLDLLQRSGFKILMSDFINQPTDGRDKGRYGIVAQLF